MSLQLPDKITARFAQLGHQNDVTAWEIGWLTTWVFEYCTVEIDGKKKV